MRYRKLSPTGDYVFGHSLADFLIDSPECVAQAILTALELFQGEWFLDLTAGVPYSTKILGVGTVPTYDLAIQQAILNVPGVTSIETYSSDLDRVKRKLSVSATVNTQYGQAEIETVL